MCEISEIPIILTCTNYNYVKKMLNFRRNACNSESIHFVKSTTSHFLRHLRVLFYYIGLYLCDVFGLIDSMKNFC